MPRSLPLFALLAVAAAACGEDESALNTREAPTSSSSSSGGEALVCPSEDPHEGEPCSQPEGTTCVSGACDDSFVACRGGLWRKSTAKSPDVLCPSVAPDDDSECPPCFPSTLVCSFGCQDAGSGLRAVCAHEADGPGRWRVTARECPSFDAGEPADAGADATSDAAP